MKLQTPVTLDPAPVSISYHDRIAVLGSCFADEIGERLAAAGFDLLCNPFGTLYNPVSIGNAVARLTAGVPFTADEVVEMGAGAGRYCSFWHHTSFARETPEAFLENANAVLEEAAAFWKDCNRVIVTLGTAWAFRFDATGETVANCLKRPGTEFTRYRLTVAQSTGPPPGTCGPPSRQAVHFHREPDPPPRRRRPWQPTVQEHVAPRYGKPPLLPCLRDHDGRTPRLPLVGGGYGPSHKTSGRLSLRPLRGMGPSHPGMGPV